MMQPQSDPVSFLLCVLKAPEKQIDPLLPRQGPVNRRVPPEEMIRHDDPRESAFLVKTGMFLPRAFSAGACQAGMHMGFIQKAHAAAPSVHFGLSYPFHL